MTDNSDAEVHEIVDGDDDVIVIEYVHLFCPLLDAFVPHLLDLRGP